MHMLMLMLMLVSYAHMSCSYIMLTLLSHGRTPCSCSCHASCHRCSAMVCCIVLWCTVLCCAVLCCAVLCCTVLTGRLLLAHRTSTQEWRVQCQATTWLACCIRPSSLAMSKKMNRVLLGQLRVQCASWRSRYIILHHTLHG